MERARVGPLRPSDEPRSFRHMLASVLAGLDALFVLGIVLFSID